jgi:hypothetical protein
MSFRILGLEPARFRPLFGLSDRELAVLGAKRLIADSKPGFPDRVEIRDAEPGQSVLLLNYTHQPADTPYRASHAIFVLEGAEKRYDRVGEIPDPLRIRQISLRAFDDQHQMVDADLIDGRELENLIERFFANSGVSYLQAHYAKRGCYAASIERG